MDDQINYVSQICYLNLRNIRKIGNRLTYDLKVQLVHANILSMIDYCNSVYIGITMKNIQKLQKTQNNAVRFIFQLNGRKKWTPISTLNKPAPANFSRTEGYFQFSGLNIWNDVPYEIRCLTDIEVFKKSLKTYYFNLAFSDVE